MAKKEIEFIVTQTGALMLTKDLGDDPSFMLPIAIYGDDDEFNKLVKDIHVIYYHTSIGWETLIEAVGASNNCHIMDRLALSQNLKDELDNVFNMIGDKALDQLFHVGNVLWDIREKLHCISIDSKDLVKKED